MSKSKEELEVLKKEVEELNEKIRELTPEELAQVSGGSLRQQTEVYHESRERSAY